MFAIFIAVLWYTVHIIWYKFYKVSKCRKMYKNRKYLLHKLQPHFFDMSYSIAICFTFKPYCEFLAFGHKIQKIHEIFLSIPIQIRIPFVLDRRRMLQFRKLIVLHANCSRRKIQFQSSVSHRGLKMKLNTTLCVILCLQKHH